MENQNDPVAFMHIATLHHYQEIIDDVLYRLQDSGLIKSLQFIHFNAVGNGDIDFSKLNPIYSDKVKFTRIGALHDNEMPTFKELIEFARSTPNTPILYLQTLSVSSYNYNIPGYKDRRELFYYFAINKYKDCLSYLNKGYDTCGCNWNKDWELFDEYNPAHWSGNIWWATSDYIKTLPEYEWLEDPNNYVLDRRHQAEFFIGMNPQVKQKSLYTWAFNDLTKERLSKDKYIK